ncbi:hypothetical protein DV738_g3308, partial [Chaetothyriales sp. CBS 135597]
MDRSNSRRRRGGQDQANGGEISDKREEIDQVSELKHNAKWSCWRPGSTLTVCVGLTLVIFSFFAAVFFLNGDAFRLVLLSKPKPKPSPSVDWDDFGIRLKPEDHIFRAPSTLEFNWEITKGIRWPDGVHKEVYLVNNRFPGQTIEARSGDRIVVNVTNLLSDEGLAFHWHGLRMVGANDMDGAVGVTQAPIPSGESFLYNFTIGQEEHGTFWYHSHEKTQREDGLYGGLVVHRPGEQVNEMAKYDYNEEILLLVGDWYHRPSQQVLEWYMNSRSFGNEPVPDSLLINGKGDFDCQMAVPARPVDCIGREDRPLRPVLRLRTGKRYRLRLVNTGALTGFSVHMDNSTLMPFQLDGGNEIPTAVAGAIGIVYPGERADSILETGSSDNQSLLTIEMDNENFRFFNPALNPTQTFAIQTASDDRSRKDVAKPDVEYYNLQAATSKSSLQGSWPQEVRKFVIYVNTMKLARLHYIPTGFINHTAWAPQQSPPEPLIYLPREEFDRNQLAPQIPLFGGDSGQDPESASSQGWVEVVINNLDDGGHPFHLHGYTFYVISIFPHPRAWSSEKTPFTPGGSGLYNYNPFKAPPQNSPGGEYNLDDPVMKDTVFVPQRGYAVIRFRADNPGIWMLHCHVGWHLGSGMAMTWDVR